GLVRCRPPPHNPGPTAVCPHQERSIRVRLILRRPLQYSSVEIPRCPASIFSRGTCQRSALEERFTALFPFRRHPLADFRSSPRFSLSVLATPIRRTTLEHPR